MGIPRIVETALSGIHREGITTYNSPFFQLCVTLPIVIPCACAKQEQSDWLCVSFQNVCTKYYAQPILQGKSSIAAV